MFARTRPKMVLADIQLADGSSGIEAVNEILSSTSVPVIFITAFPERLLTGERPEPAFLVQAVQSGHGQGVDQPGAVLRQASESRCIRSGQAPPASLPELLACIGRGLRLVPPANAGLGAAVQFRIGAIFRNRLFQEMVEQSAWNHVFCSSIRRETDMLYWALVFLVVAIIAGALGFGGVVGASVGIAKIPFFIFSPSW